MGIRCGEPSQIHLAGSAENGPELGLVGDNPTAVEVGAPLFVESKWSLDLAACEGLDGLIALLGRIEDHGEIRKSKVGEKNFETKDL